MISLGWGNSNENLLIWRMENAWNGDMFQETLDYLFRLMSSKCGVIDILMDLQTDNEPPANLLDALSALKNIPHNLGRVVVIGASDDGMNSFYMATQDYNLPELDIHFVHDANDAYNLIYAQYKAC